VKKTQRASKKRAVKAQQSRSVRDDQKKRVAAKEKGKGAGPGGAGARAGKRDAAGRKSAGRIPVRGARGGGVKTRAAVPEAPALRARSAADVEESRTLAVAAMDAALDKKALLPVLIDVSAMASYTDFIGIVSGRSDRQVDAISDSICQVMKAHGRQVLGQEGTGSGRWTLLDFGAFVIHVFLHPVREFYDLESLWIDAPRVKLDVPPESAHNQADALYGAL
jgi:ribosome-associated protein